MITRRAALIAMGLSPFALSRASTLTDSIDDDADLFRPRGEAFDQGVDRGVRTDQALFEN